MDKIFHELLGKTMELYIDDMVVKLVKAKQHATDLEAVFSKVRRHEMLLNPEKCFFGIKGGKFLGFMITQTGIEANRDKCEVILGMRSPTCLKEVQQLNNRLAALSRFIPKLTEKSKSFFRLLKGVKEFIWGDTCEHRFTQIKKDISALPIVALLAINSVLVYEEWRKQRPVYFTSRTLQPVEERHQIIEKLVLALVFSAKRLRNYFRSHNMTIKTDYPIKKVLQNHEFVGRMTT